jgi:chaperonin cofactor prefoldin
MATKQELKKRISIYEDNLKYWTKQKKTAEAEIKNCREMIRKYKADLKNA